MAGWSYAYSLGVIIGGSVTQVLSIVAIVDHIHEVGAEVRVLETSVFKLQLKTRIDSEKQCILPAYNKK
jgi:hypothetical protein